MLLGSAVLFLALYQTIQARGISTAEAGAVISATTWLKADR
jgi:hypothetical protein